MELIRKENKYILLLVENMSHCYIFKHVFLYILCKSCKLNDKKKWDSSKIYNNNIKNRTYQCSIVCTTVLCKHDSFIISLLTVMNEFLKMNEIRWMN